MQKTSVEKFPLRNIIDAVIIPVIIFSYGKQRRIGRLAFLKGLREIQDSITAAQLTIPDIALAYHLIIVIQIFIPYHFLIGYKNGIDDEKGNTSQHSSTDGKQHPLLHTTHLLSHFRLRSAYLSVFLLSLGTPRICIGLRPCQGWLIRFLDAPYTAMLNKCIPSVFFQKSNAGRNISCDQQTAALYTRLIPHKGESERLQLFRKL